MRSMLPRASETAGGPAAAAAAAPEPPACPMGEAPWSAFQPRLPSFPSSAVAPTEAPWGSVPRADLALLLPSPINRVAAPGRLSVDGKRVGGTTAARPPGLSGEPWSGGACCRSCCCGGSAGCSGPSLPGTDAPPAANHCSLLPPPLLLLLLSPLPPASNPAPIARQAAATSSSCWLRTTSAASAPPEDILCGLLSSSPSPQALANPARKLSTYESPAPSPPPPPPPPPPSGMSARDSKLSPCKRPESDGGTGDDGEFDTAPPPREPRTPWV